MLPTKGQTVMTKREYRAIRAEWSHALQAGRVVSFGDGSTMRAYPSIAMRDDATAQAARDGIAFRICAPDSAPLLPEGR